MFTLNKLTIIMTLFIFTCTANSTIITTMEDATNGGGFFAEITFVNNGANTVTVTADISDSINQGLSKGDILGIWFDISDASLLSGMPTFSGATSILDFEYGENSVGSSLGGNLNMNGAGETNWDMALQVGTNGSRGGFVQTLSFDITAPGLDELLFANQRMGMRVQSIEGTNFNAGSSKLLGTSFDIAPEALQVSNFRAVPTNLLNTTVTKVTEPNILLIYGIGILGIGLMARRYSFSKPLN